ncbi:MAG TPA: glycosyltransferase [Thermodesulfobacteriota bacterium]|nr:glycosyltransferase [Thermodesulfobacteriota bacterium]
MKVAIIHDWLTGMRGGERCLEIFCELFPQADLYTLLHVPGSVSPCIERMPIKTSFIQNLPFSKKGYRKYLPLFPMAIESFNLKGYDLILSCSHCVAKGIITPPDALHISYVLTPMRYAWDMYDEYFREKRNRMIPFFIHYLRIWDVTSIQRVDHFMCISKHVENRIKKFYRREAEIIHPPVDSNRFKIHEQKENYFLIVSSLAPYKRIDLAVEAFNRLGYPLKIIGSGPEEKRLKAKAGPNVEFCGWLPEDVVADAYSKCRALIFSGEEDFGIVPLEAMASGRPVIAYGRGGALETIISYDQKEKTEGSVPTGLFFHEPNGNALIDAIERFVTIEKEFDPLAIRNHTLKWDRKIFKEKMKGSIFNKMKSKC